jgi:hypothetical protein
VEGECEFKSASESGAGVGVERGRAVVGGGGGERWVAEVGGECRAVGRHAW